MFWRKMFRREGKETERGVKEIAGRVWGHMLIQHGVTVDILQNLRRVECDGVVEDKPVIIIRIFDPAAAGKKGVAIEDYDSLDGHPDLILYGGYYRSVLGVTTDIHIEKK